MPGDSSAGVDNDATRQARISDVFGDAGLSGGFNSLSTLLSGGMSFQIAPGEGLFAGVNGAAILRITDIPKDSLSILIPSCKFHFLSEV